jgi:hypothetical protein
MSDKGLLGSMRGHSTAPMHIADMRMKTFIPSVEAGISLTNTPRIQECHIAIGHIVCERVEQRPESQRDD